MLDQSIPVPESGAEVSVPFLPIRHREPGASLQVEALLYPRARFTENEYRTRGKSKVSTSVDLFCPFYNFLSRILALVFNF